MNDALHEKGIQFDLNQFKPENLEELIAQLKDLKDDIDCGAPLRHVRFPQGSILIL